jgi:pimeloyl-ACP methyl ester carboxylesterase
MFLLSYLKRIQRCGNLLVWGRAPSPVQAERSSAAACGHGNSGFAIALAILALLAIPSSLCALPVPKTPPPTPPPALRTVRMVQQSIPMPDGVHLSATLYMPGDAKPGEKFPALLEYLPYRKDDATAARDYPIHAWFAARGYVSVRVDIRGFGSSEGTPTDREYSEQEQLDGEQVIAWLAAQPWSTGKVGMFGISWGGFNSIQLAMRNTTLYLYDAHVLSTDPAKPAVHQLRYIPSVGVEAGFWWGELLTDQRPVDAFSLTYDSALLKVDLTILGRPHALLQASSSAPLADWFARLSDVAPDGTVTQVTGAGINGAQRDSASEPKDLVPNQTYPLDIEMHLATWTFPKGHRIRLAVSNALWPMVWPTPSAMTTTLQLGGNTGSRLTLPLVPPSMYAIPQFAPPEPSEQRSDIQSAGFPWPGDWKTERDELNGKTKVTWTGKSEETYPWGKETDFEGLTYLADDTHPETSSVQAEAEIVMALKQQTLTWQGHLTLTSDTQNFYYKYTRQLFKDGQQIKQKTWQETIPRDHQ